MRNTPRTLRNTPRASHNTPRTLCNTYGTLHNTPRTLRNTPGTLCNALKKANGFAMGVLQALKVGVLVCWDTEINKKPETRNTKVQQNQKAVLCSTGLITRAHKGSLSVGHQLKIFHIVRRRLGKGADFFILSHCLALQHNVNYPHTHVWNTLQVGPR